MYPLLIWYTLLKEAAVVNSWEEILDGEPFKVIKSRYRQKGTLCLN
jgi:hypothetical protein